MKERVQMRDRGGEAKGAKPLLSQVKVKKTRWAVSIFCMFYAYNHFTILLQNNMPSQSSNFVTF